MPDSDPFASTPTAPSASAVGEIAVPHDDEAVRVRALVEARLLGESEPAVATVGRFLLLERLGEGGMGVVWAAYDPQLDRKVAVKLLRREQTDAAIRKRILREAQAMARLSHPNVAQVFEVGEHRGQTFIALEYVRGKTLRAWQHESSRNWREVLQVYAQAGRGLVAAHDVGLVHRDFKPDNAMLGRDDRVRVLDFGLARTGEGITATDLQLDTLLPSPGEDALATPLTHDGAVMGTPAYMAPEQLLGEATDARTDQFCFCVALWEALYGERPFAGSSRVELIGNVTGGRLRSVPKQSKVPPWIRAVLERGLEVAPSQRYPTIAELLAALANDPTRRRRRWIAVGATIGVLAVGGAAVEGLRRHDLAQRVLACDEAGARIDEVWNDDRRARVKDAIAATGLSYAPTTAEKVVPWIDAAAQAWRAEMTRACTSTTVDRTWTADTFDRSSWCLDERQLELGAFVEQLEHADAEVFDSALQTAADFAAVGSCTDVASLAVLPPPPDASVRDGITATRGELARVGALRRAGKSSDALELVQGVKREAEAHAWPPLIAVAYVVEAHVMLDTSPPDEAERALTSAYAYAAKHDVWDLANAAALSLVHHIGATAQRTAEGRTWLIHAEVAATRAGDPTGLREAERLRQLGSMGLTEGDLVGGLAHYERALEILERVLGADHPVCAGIVTAIGAVHYASGEYQDARTDFERALAMEEAANGPEHPDVAGALVNLGNTLYHLRAVDEAQPYAERALEIYERAFGPEHVGVAKALALLSDTHAASGETEVALRLAQRDLEIRERNFGAASPQVALGLDAVAQVLLGSKRWEEARAPLERALAIREQAFGPEHPDVSFNLSGLAQTRFTAGDLEGARAYWERSLAIDEATQGPRAPDLSYPLVGLARVATAQGRHADAVVLATRGLDLREAAGMTGSPLGDAQFVLARALWDASPTGSPERARGVALATAARGEYRGLPDRDEELAEMDAWLARASK